MTTVSITGVKRMMKTLRQMPVEMGKANESIVKMTAVRLCVELGRATGPGRTLTDKPILDYQKAVEWQIRSVFPSRANPAAVAALIKPRSTALYYGYLRAMKKGKESQARRYLRDAGITMGEISRAAHDAARTGTGRSIPRNAPVVSVVNAAAVRVYVREERRRAGMAKAAWYQAAGGIVKRVRGTARDASGGRSSFQRFPATLRAVARKFPGLGRSEVSGSGMRTSVYIASRVRHAGEALEQADIARARVAASLELSKAIQQTIHALNKKLFGNQ